MTGKHIRKQGACMKNLLCAVSLAASCAIAAEADLSKSWTLSTWGGYEPLAKVEQTNGTIHVSDVQSKYGFGMRSGKRIQVRAGDTVKFTAPVRGKGEMFFQLQNFDADDRWIGVARSSVTKTLPSEWRTVTFSVLAENSGKNVGVRHAHVRRQPGQRTLPQGHAHFRRERRLRRRLPFPAQLESIRARSRRTEGCGECDS